MYRPIAIGIISVAAIVSLTACSTRQMVGGAAAGGAAYEYSNKRAMDSLEADYEAGRISREEYERRKQQIEERSLLY